MYNISTADGPGFARISEEMTERIRKLGPNPVRLGASPDAGEKAAAAIASEVSASVEAEIKEECE